ncbi:hypothetical protein F511_00995 [Dorcoceras hygrometricum]|uniref:Uncharacterized protein n=1 Tax=Dorcoceras hygrometricum TaxID=472368 RepID=A0A2Z7AEU0_9LAMI|nr:hypothetical protein F511_00995 [Dorcoceras hygrometricum]
MGSVGFCGESESQPSTSNSKKSKSPRKLLDEGSAVNHTAIPRKLRSAIKKRGLESMNPPLPISKKQNSENGVETLRKSGAKKSKLTTKQGRITKDEKEVAETLYLLANMFNDTKKSDEQGLDVHLSETNSLTVLETMGTMTTAQGSTDTGKIAARVALEAICQTSNVEVSTSKITRLKSFDDPQLSKLSISQQYPIPFTYGDRIDLDTGSRSSMNKLPSWFETTNHVIQHHIPEESFTKNKRHLVNEATRLRKRCSSHVYISHLIKVIQVLDRKERLPETRSETGPPINIDDYQKNGIDYTSGALSSSVSSIRDTIFLHKSLFQDQQQASKMPVSWSPLKQQPSFIHPMNVAVPPVHLVEHRSFPLFLKLTPLYILGLKGTLILCFMNLLKQLPLPLFDSSRLRSSVAALFPAQSRSAGLPTSDLQDWKSGERDSSFFVTSAQAQSHLPHLHSTPGLKYQQFPQQQFNTIHLPESLLKVKGNGLRLPSGFDRNRATCHPGNMSQLQIFSNQPHL